MKRFTGAALAVLSVLGCGAAAQAQEDPFAPVGAVQPAAAPTGGPARIQNGSFEATVSAEQLSRLSIVGDRIVSVRTMQDPEGPQMLVEAEEATGDVYVGFDGPALGRTFSLFLVTASGRTVQGNLNVAAVPGQTVLIAGGEPAAAGPTVDRTERRSDYLETVTAIVRVMFRGDQPEGIRCFSRQGQSREMGPYSVRLVRTCEAAGFRGQELNLLNSSAEAAPVLVDPFLVAGVVAAAADRDELLPGASARVFLVEESR